MWGSYWHKNDDPQERIDHFRQFGFETCIVEEDELKDQKMLVNKLQKFHEQKFEHTINNPKEKNSPARA